MEVENNTWKYTVEGMSCDHCAKALMSDVAAIEGVNNVEVSFENKVLTLNSEKDSTEAVKTAVDKAGYAIV